MAVCGIVLAFFVFALAEPVPLEALEGRVVRVLDGDTYDVALPGGIDRVRCLLIDTPELHHPFRGQEELGDEARKAARLAIDGGTVFLEVPDPPRDRYGRLLCHVFYRDRPGTLRLLSAELCRLGLALPFPMGDLTHLEDVEASTAWAASKGRGLWGLGRRRVFTPAQAAWEAPSLRGSFIEVRLTVKSVRKGRTLWVIGPKEGKIKVSIRSEAAARMAPDIFTPGSRLGVTGKVTTDRGGIVIEVGSPSQIRPLVR